MARTFMPKSGIMMPYIVAHRDAAVAGVETVDGLGGTVNLENKYLQITSAADKYYTKDETYDRAAIEFVVDALMQLKIDKLDPVIPNNTSLKAEGGPGFGIDKIDLIKATPGNEIVIGELENGVQGVKIYSQGRVAVVDKDPSDNSKERVNPLYSSRYKPTPSAIGAATVADVTTDPVTGQTNVRYTGVNTDIKELRGLTTPLALTVGGTGANSKAGAQASLGLSMPDRGNIAQSVNLNDLVGSADNYGYWKQPVTTYATTANNYPIAEAGDLIIKGNNTNGNGCSQEYTTYSTNVTYRRMYLAVSGNPTGGKWTSWARDLKGYQISALNNLPASEGWKNATRAAFTNVYFTPWPDSLTNDVSIPQFLDPPTNKVPNPEWPGYPNANAPWGFGINDKDRSLNIWGGPTEDPAIPDPDRTKSPLVAAPGKGRLFNIGAKTIIKAGDAIGHLQVNAAGGNTTSWITVARPSGNLAEPSPTPASLSSTSIGAIRMGGNSVTGDVQIDAAYQGGIRWFGNRATQASSVQSQWSAAVEAVPGGTGGLASSGSFSIQFMRDHTIHYNAAAGGSHQFNGTVTASSFTGPLNGNTNGTHTGGANLTGGSSVHGSGVEFHWIDDARSDYGSRMFINLAGGVARMYYRDRTNTGGVKQGYVNFPKPAVNTSVTLSFTSDERLKSDIKDLPSGALDRVSKIRPVSFNWTKGGQWADYDYNGSKGFIAQELYAVDKSYVKKPKDEFKDDMNDRPWELELPAIMSDMVLAIKELKSEVDSLKAEIAELKAKK